MHHNLVVALSYCIKDLAQAERLLLWIKFLDKVNKLQSSGLVLFPDEYATSQYEHEIIWSLAQSVFGWVRCVPVFVGNQRYPLSSNAHLRAAIEIAEKSQHDMLFLEPDSIPVTSSWLDDLNSAWTRSDKVFMGRKLNDSSTIGGVAVYAHNWRSVAPSLSLFHNVEWDIACSPDMSRSFDETELIQHGCYTSLDGITRSTVLFHHCKGSQLMKDLDKERFNGEFFCGKDDVISSSLTKLTSAVVLKKTFLVDNVPHPRPVVEMIQHTSSSDNPWSHGLNFPAKPTGKKDTADLIIDFYRQLKSRPQLPRYIIDDCSTLEISSPGLGDHVVLTDAPHSARSVGKRVSLWSRNDVMLKELGADTTELGADTTELGTKINALELIRRHDCGNGHMIQRFQRALDAPVSLRPRGRIPSNVSDDNIIVIHLEPGQHSKEQQKFIHPRARTLRRQDRRELEAFIRRCGKTCVEIGRHPTGLIGAQQLQVSSISEIISVISRASLFIGVMSGPLHIAAALDKPVISIINFPPANAVYLPTLVPFWQVEEEWFYPQAVHLHLDSEGPLVPQFSAYTLEKAVNGEVYPFWKDDWLDLISYSLP